jgi:hypothetical protein
MELFRNSGTACISLQNLTHYLNYLLTQDIHVPIHKLDLKFA